MVLVYYKIIFRKGPHFKHVFFSFLKITLFIFLFLAMLGLYCCAGFSLVVESGGYSLVGVQFSHCGGFSCCAAQAYRAFRFSCPTACGVLPDQGSNLCPLQWKHGILTTEPPGKFHDGSLIVGCKLIVVACVGSSSWTRDWTQAPCIGSSES